MFIETRQLGLGLVGDDLIGDALLFFPSEVSKYRRPQGLTVAIDDGTEPQAVEIKEPPDPEATAAHDLQEGASRFAQVPSMDAENAEEYGQLQCHDTTPGALRQRLQLGCVDVGRSFLHSAESSIFAKGEPCRRDDSQAMMDGPLDGSSSMLGLEKAAAVLRF